MILAETLKREISRLDAEEARASRARFACLARCDYDGARAEARIADQARQQRDALVNGELFVKPNET